MKLNCLSPLFNFPFRLNRFDPIHHISGINKFDVSNAALHWVKDHEKLLQNCYRALKAGGVIRFNFAGDGNCSNFIEIIHDVMNYPHYKVYFNNFVWPWFMPRISEYERLLNQQKFKELRCWEENADRNFRTKDEIVKWIDQPSIVPFLEVLPKEKQPGFRDEVVNRMVYKTKNSDGTYFETFRRINVFARK
ncbi:MAG TPA: class I SAM-dependent methyltransferase [Peptococcaceae bacterium]|nr:class I SAM-dependent methyltransferase [Peptococcaceae bacterium]